MEAKLNSLNEATKAKGNLDPATVTNAFKEILVALIFLRDNIERDRKEQFSKLNGIDNRLEALIEALEVHFPGLQEDL
jgi:hypothetical protein